MSIGPNAVIAAGSVINKSVGGGVYGGVPAKYICSLDELADKRKRYNDFIVEKRNGELTDKIIENCWKRFTEKNGD